MAEQAGLLGRGRGGDDDGPILRGGGERGREGEGEGEEAGQHGVVLKRPSGGDSRTQVSLGG